MNIRCLVVWLAGCCQSVVAQPFTDTVSVVTYNINNYGFASTGSCPLIGSPLKTGYLKTVVQYLAPDIVAFEKINGSPVTISIDTIQQKVMDSICTGCYSNAVFTNVSGYQKVNSLFYKTAKFGYLGTTGIYTTDNNISDINLHKLYYKSPDLATTADTIFLDVIVAHLTSGSGNASDRATQIAGAMNWLKAHTAAPANYIFLGDFNTQKSSEACFQNMVNSTDSNTRFYDPPNQVGNWSSNPSSFALYLTQSTRTSDPGDCSATGGLNDRFDHILCTKPIMNGTLNMQYIPGSYKVMGQDGLHTNKAITASPTNTLVPANVLNALYMMSEHLPVTLRLAIHTNTTLPLGFVSFKAQRTGNATILKWQAINNNEVKSYDVEVSPDGVDFVAIGTVQCRGANCYYNDAAHYNSNIIFYRIRQVMKSGGVQYSNILKVMLQAVLNLMTVSPNPVKNTLTIYIKSQENDNAIIRITNGLGQTVMERKSLLQKGNNTISLTNLAALQSGLYVLRLVTGTDSYSANVVKE